VAADPAHAPRRDADHHGVVDPDARYQTAGEFQEALLRCAHRNGLMMSAPELAQHLRLVCGPPARWRDVEGRDATGTAAIGGGGTEVYDAIADGTDQIDLSDEEDDEISEVSDVEPSFSPGIEMRRAREQTSMTMLGRLQGIELTSMINASEGDDGEGAAPLVDLDDFGPPPMRADASEVPIAPAARRPEPSDVVLAAPPRRPLDIERTEAMYRMSAPRSSRLLPWALGGALLLVGGTTAAAIGLSGPEIAPGEPAGSASEPRALPAAVPTEAPLPAAAPSPTDAALPPDARVPADAAARRK
jgi:hypothetical protein